MGISIITPDPPNITLDPVNFRMHMHEIKFRVVQSAHACVKKK